MNSPLPGQQEKAKRKALLDQVQLNRQDLGMQALRRLLESRLAEEQSKLLRCPLDKVQQIQGSAQMLETLIAEIFA